MSDKKASAEELDETQAYDELDEESSEEEFEEEVEVDETEESEEQSEEEELEEEEKIPSVPLDQYTSAKDTLNRLADKYLSNEDDLAELAEEDPRLLARLKKEFPKKFKHVQVPKEELSLDDIDARLDARIAEREQANQVDNLRKELGLTAIEFSDFKEELVERAEKYFDAEVTDSFEEATLLALKKIKPSLASELNAKRQTKRKITKIGSGKSAKKQSKTEFEKLEDEFAADMPKGWSAK